MRRDEDLLLIEKKDKIVLIKKFLLIIKMIIFINYLYLTITLRAPLKLTEN